MTMFCFSQNEEHFHQETEADSMEQAKVVAEGELQLKPGEVFYVGVKSPIIADTYVDGDDILFLLGERVSEDIGEAAEGWPDATQEQIAVLTGRIREVVRAWIRETGNEPGFYAVRSVESFVVKPKEGES